MVFPIKKNFWSSVIIVSYSNNLYFVFEKLASNIGGQNEDSTNLVMSDANKGRLICLLGVCFFAPDALCILKLENEDTFYRIFWR